MRNQWSSFSFFLLVASKALAEDGISEKTILLGQTIGVTGTIAGPVKEMTEGANAYFELINSQGGIFGRKIDLRILDDKFDPKLTASNAESLIKKQRVFAMFQTRGTPHTQAVLALLKENQIPLIAPGTGATLFHQPINPLLFNVRAKYQTEVEKAIEHLSTTGVKEIGVLYVDDSFGLDGLEGFNNAMTARSLKPVTVTKFDRVKPDYQATADAVIKANPKALLIISSSKNTIEAIKAIRAKGSQMQLVTLSNNSSQSFIKELGPAGAGVIVCQITPAPNLSTTELGKEFKTAAKASGATVSYAGMEGFIAAKVLVEGLRRTGRNLTRERFIDALESMKKVDLGGLMINYNNKTHSGSEFVELTMIGKNGNFIR
ncbi:MAG: ABC transporter substrate-binding protein [Pseudomonadota bacterium]